MDSLWKFWHQAANVHKPNCPPNIGLDGSKFIPHIRKIDQSIRGWFKEALPEGVGMTQKIRAVRLYALSANVNVSVKRT
jgi:hypothetical protein